MVGVSKCDLSQQNSVVRLPQACCGETFNIHNFNDNFRPAHRTEQIPTMSEKAPLRVVITGAAGQIAYSLIYQVASGYVFGPDQVGLLV